MANDDHIAQLKKNAGREENRDIIPDLRGANFSRANLGEAKTSAGRTRSLGG
jgi:hypothetical protein